MKRLQILLISMLLLTSVGNQRLWAQGESHDNNAAPTQNSVLQNISPESESIFLKYMPRKDSTFLKRAIQKDTFWKRVSFHFNTLDWLLTVPSMGVEIDLNKTQKNNKSILVFGKYNGNSSHTVKPRIVFNYAAARVEFRKYWRTGDVGKESPEGLGIKKIVTKDSKKIIRDSVIVNEYGDSVILKDRIVEYEDPEQHELFLDNGGDPTHGKLYNKYQAFRRNFTSGRTIREPRNWRAYYLGAYAQFDKYNLLITKKGWQGSGLSVGATLGWTIPMLTRKFPNEGGLDLDIGALVGVRMVKYDRYAYESYYDSKTDEINACYRKIDNKSKSSWSLAKWPWVQELRVSLVYRFRTVRNKVSLALVDDYDKNATKMMNERREKYEQDLQHQNEYNDSLMQANAKNTRIAADSASYADAINRHRFEAALRLNPDTTFTGEEDTLYYKLIKGIDLRDEKQVKRMNDSIETARKLFVRDSTANAKKIADSIKVATKKAAADSIAGVKKAKAEAKKLADSIKVVEKKAAADSIAGVKKAQAEAKKATADSLAEVKKLQADSIAGAKKAEADSIATAKKDNAEKLAADKKEAAEKAAADKKTAAEEKAKAKEEAAAKKKQEAEEKAKAKAEAAAKKKEEAEAKAKAKKEEAEAKAKAKADEAAEKVKAKEEEAKKTEDEAKAKDGDESKSAEEEKKADEKPAEENN